jgi:hypothetical protein
MNSRKKKFYRILSLYLAFNLLAQVCWPTAAFALTNGPGQPEFQSFEPAGTTEMVNLFTGDFNYNIPLMTVPGPNGGYPINLAYHAGISMEQEASWVGLGWNINAGAINRSMRGLPDDFDGEQVTKELHYKPSTTFSFSLGHSFLDLQTKKEILGFGKITYSLGAGVNLYYNNYRGIGFGYNFGLSNINVEHFHFVQNKALPLSLNLSASSDGIGVNLGVGPSKEKIWFPGGGLSWGSREGIKSISLGGQIHQRKEGGYPYGAGITFAKSGYVPVSTPEMTGFISMLGISLGSNTNFNWDALKGTSLDASLTRSSIKDETQHPNSFGYLYADQSQAIYDQNILEDLNIEKDTPPSRESKNIGVPVATYDVYNVSGQGTGGSFRPYRSDIGIYTEPKVTSTIRGGKINVEIGPKKTDTIPPSTTYSWGANGSYAQSQTYSGMWFNHFFVGNGGNQGWDALNYYKFHSTGTDNLYEPFYFKMSGEQTAAPSDQLSFLRGDLAVRYKLNELFDEDDDGIAVRPEIVTDGLYLGRSGSEAPLDLDYTKQVRTSREKRIVSNQSYTNGELSRFAATEPKNIFSTINGFPATGVYTPGVYNYSHSSEQIGSFTEVNPDGNRYVYGIPVYSSEKDVAFAFKDGFKYDTSYSSSAYSADEASIKNELSSTDQYFSSTSIPDYATSYLLSAIYSPDYVDLTGDGPTDDDLGYFVKFNYVKTNSAYKWRAPYWGAIRNTGFLSNANDDKLSYEYGEKEIYMLHSIETKTHVACFVLQNANRQDGHEAIDELAWDTPTNESAVATAGGLRALDHISLYSKADPYYGTGNAVALKEVYFTYNYSLCPGVHNNGDRYSPGPDSGKLTLQSFYFKYNGGTKGKLNPYSFDYVDMGYDADFLNPQYNPRENDRWGSYKPQAHLEERYLNKENPYTDQKGINRTKVNWSAAAWCLKKITLPSGSTISVNYEADDYAYVQDKPAAEMCRIVGTLKQSQNLIGEISNYIDNNHTRICFELDTTYSDAAPISEIAKYLSGLQEIYFKIFTKLKKPFDEPLGVDDKDYVTGYCKLDFGGSNPYGFVDEGTGNPRHYGYFSVKLVDRDDYPITSGGIKLHPFCKAAFQYIYLDRPDLFASPDVDIPSTIANLAVAATSMITEIRRAVLPYAYATGHGWARQLDVDNSTLECGTRPSYVRLTTPDGIKAGGGHRVKSIIMTDAWETLSGSNGKDATYGISYTYRLPDGKSSGVAAYEPMIGGDEIALRKPIRYNSDNLVKSDEAFYVEEPMGESYFPAPVVGYSRVVVKSIVGVANKDEDGNDITKSRVGQTVYEFYTARDFPVICSQTDLQKTWFPVPVFLPFIGSITYNNRGFSQGYSVVLNDMHGKLKSVSTYSTKDNLITGNPIPVRRVEYKYHTDESGHNLRSDVNVLTADGEITSASLGETYDFYNDLRQHSNETLELGGQININMQTTTGVALPVFLPIINISRSLYRSAATVKVIYRTGILTEVKTIDDGATSVAKNLLFDAETGAPLLTTVTNEFEKPVYTYNYAAHWAYDGMKGAYNNVGAKYIGETTNGSGQLTGITNAGSVFFPGDEVMYIPSGGPGQMLTVTNASGSVVNLIKSDGTAATGLFGDFIIARSGHRNQQSVSNGVIVSLSDPTQNRQFPLFTSLNLLSDLEEETPYSYTDCASGETVSYSVIADDHANSIIIHTETGCEASINLPASFDVEDIDQFDDCNFTKAGNNVTIDFPGDPDVIATWEDNNQCFNECIDDVLHASATRFLDEWTMNFEDVGVSPAPGYNPYVFAEKGVWRTESNYLYQVDRKQSSVAGAVTDISKDGTYQNFVLYNWNADPDKNKHWSYVSRITQYSPYGYALESSDALGIYSASLFGYANTKQIASASNCKYFEIGNDAFEDYGGTYPSANGHGHLLFTTAGATDPDVSTVYAHTGKNSLKVTYASDAAFVSSSIDGLYAPTQQYFEPQPNGKYNLSVWARATGGGTPAIVIDNGTPVTYTPDLSKSLIEGWYRFDISFTAPASSGTLTIKLVCQTSGAAYFDDVRIQPFTSAMVSYVYDPQTHWLLAELDNRNFATLYNYDEEGSVVQVKQETEKGVFTIKTARSNIQH